MSDISPLECQFMTDGCKRIFYGQKDLEDHTTICPYFPISCPQCQETVCKKDLLNHMQTTCQFRNVNCQFCESNVPNVHLNDHEKVCDEKPVECQYCGMVELQKNLGNHYETCTVKEDPCRLAPFKCTFKGNLKEREEHYKDVNTHLQLVCLFLAEEMSKNNNNISNNLDNFLANLREVLDVPNKFITSMNVVNKELENELEILEDKKENVDNSSKTDFETKAVELSETLLEELKGIKEQQQHVLINSSSANMETNFAELMDKIEMLKEQQITTSAKLLEENQKLKTEIKGLLTMQAEFSRIINKNFKILSKSYSKEMEELRNQIKKLSSEIKGEDLESFSLAQDTSIEDISIAG